jgi:hypothetical protein
MRLEEFRLKSYKEREVLMLALTYFESYRSSDWPNLKEALDELQIRIARTQCQPGGCEYCEE